MSSPDVSPADADADDLNEDSLLKGEGIENDVLKDEFNKPEVEKTIAEMEGFIFMVSGDPYGVGGEKQSYGTVNTYKESNCYKIIIDLTVPSRPSIDDIERCTRDLIHHLAVASNGTLPSWTSKGRRTQYTTVRTWKLKGLKGRQLKAVPKAAVATSSEVKFPKAAEKKKLSATETKVSKKGAARVRGIVINDTKEVATKEKECAGKGKQKVYDVKTKYTKAEIQNYIRLTGSTRAEVASTSKSLIPDVVEDNNTTVVRVSKPRKCKK